MRSDYIPGFARTVVAFFVSNSEGEEGHQDRRRDGRRAVGIGQELRLLPPPSAYEEAQLPQALCPAPEPPTRYLPPRHRREGAESADEARYSAVAAALAEPIRQQIPDRDIRGQMAESNRRSRNFRSENSNGAGTTALLRESNKQDSGPVLVVGWIDILPITLRGQPNKPKDSIMANDSVEAAKSFRELFTHFAATIPKVFDDMEKTPAS